MWFPPLLARQDKRRSHFSTSAAGCVLWSKDALIFQHWPGKRRSHFSTLAAGHVLWGCIFLFRTPLFSVGRPLTVACVSAFQGAFFFPINKILRTNI